MTKYTKLLLIALTLKIVSATQTFANDIATTEDTIINTLDNITCETQGVGDLLRSEFSHTCIPAPFFTFLIANIVAPGTYANTVLKLKINDDNLDYLVGSCLRDNRIDYTDQKITFGLCNNILLTVARAEAVANSVIAIGESMVTGDDPWDNIKSQWSIDESTYHIPFLDQREGDSGIMVDVGILPIVPWKIVKEDDRLCVATTTLAFDWIPVGCKYIKEPYPESQYASFMDPTNSQGCYQTAYENSKTGIVISSPLIECIKEMATNLALGSSDVSESNGSPTQENTTLFQFQSNMHKAVSALLAIYVIFFGFKILLRGEVPPKNELIIFALKIIFVTYFSIGININSSSSSGRFDGMSSLAFPFMLGGIQQIAAWVINAGVSNLCNFTASALSANNIDSYSSGFEYIAIWDSLDCRVSHYLGLDMLQTMIVENQSRNHDFAHFDFFNFSIPPYYYLLIPAVISGNMMLVTLAVMYPLLVISVSAYLINSMVVCTISITILGILSPIFVPMLLFDYTKKFFEAWVKLLISFMLQPMVVVAFIVTMFSIYDVGFYGQCKYVSATVNSNNRATQIFYIDNNWDNYDSQDDVSSCQNSLGYMLNNPIASLYNFSSSTLEGMTTPTTSTQQYVSKFPFLKALSSNPSLFFTSTTLLFDKIKDITLALITACFTLYLMYHFSAQLSEFAADMTEGVSLSGSTIGPQTLFKAGMKALGGFKGAGKVMSALGKGRPDIAGGGAKGKDSNDEAAIGSRESGDKTTSEGRGNSDKISSNAGNNNISSDNISVQQFGGNTNKEKPYQAKTVQNNEQNNELASRSSSIFTSPGIVPVTGEKQQTKQAQPDRADQDGQKPSDKKQSSSQDTSQLTKTSETPSLPSEEKEINSNSLSSSSERIALTTQLERSSAASTTYRQPLIKALPNKQLQDFARRNDDVLKKTEVPRKLLETRNAEVSDANDTKATMSSIRESKRVVAKSEDGKDKK
ncbi:MAG: type IV secretion system protein [Janthinobacterium lividum]